VVSATFSQLLTETEARAFSGSRRRRDGSNRCGRMVVGREGCWCGFVCTSGMGLVTSMWEKCFNDRLKLKCADADGV